MQTPSNPAVQHIRDDMSVTCCETGVRNNACYIAHVLMAVGQIATYMSNIARVKRPVETPL